MEDNVEIKNLYSKDMHVCIYFISDWPGCGKLLNLFPMVIYKNDMNDLVIRHPKCPLLTEIGINLSIDTKMWAMHFLHGLPY